MGETQILFIVGLTGVGKSSTLVALEHSGITFTLLPNRRTLTDEIIIPQMQLKAGQTPHPVSDRVARFELTARYRESYAGGMAHVVHTYLSSTPLDEAALQVFDNLRGVNEVRGGMQLFPYARFIMLDAPEEVRLQRILGRDDAFDQVKGAALLDANAELPHLPGTDPKALAKAVKIVQTEKQHYDAKATAEYLKTHLDAHHLLYLDTSQLTINDTVAHITAWL